MLNNWHLLLMVVSHFSEGMDMDWWYSTALIPCIFSGGGSLMINPHLIHHSIAWLLLTYPDRDPRFLCSRPWKSSFTVRLCEGISDADGPRVYLMPTKWRGSGLQLPLLLKGNYRGIPFHHGRLTTLLNFSLFMIRWFMAHCKHLQRQT